MSGIRSRDPNIDTQVDVEGPGGSATMKGPGGSAIVEVPGGSTIV